MRDLETLVIAAILFALPTGAPIAEQSGQTAVVRGRVVDGVTGRPVGRARIDLHSDAMPRSTLASPKGEFEFRGLPEGNVALTSEKSGYLKAWHPARPRDTVRVRLLNLRAGDRVDNVVITMFRRPAITGRVVDEYGDPVENVHVRAWRVGPSGARVIVRGSVATNDIGEYRLNGLEPGRYLVAALPSFNFRRDADRETPSFGITFYPGVAGLDQAQPVDLPVGQTVGSIDMTLLEGPATSVTGVVVDAGGKPIAGGGVTAFAVLANVDLGQRLAVGGATIRENGTFDMRIPPGEYEFQALTGSAPSYPGFRNRAVARATVGLQPVTDVTLTAAPLTTVTGRIVFEGSGKRPTPQQLHMTMTAAVDWDHDYCQAATVIQPKADWTFTHSDVWGRCVIRSRNDADWVIKSVRQGSADFTDREIEFRPGVDVNLEIVLTDRVTALVPQVTDERGATTHDYVLLAFADERERWGEQSRHIRAYAPPMDSTREAGVVRDRGVRGLPPGTYHVIALEDLAYEDMRDPALLDSLIREATRVTLAEGERRVVALRRITTAPR
jgi:hypothetical protein